MKNQYYIRFLWCLLLLSASPLARVYAQNSSIVWQRTIEDYLEGVKMATTNDGSVVILDTKIGTPTITKLNADGSIAWTKTVYGSTSSQDTLGAYVPQLYLIEATRDGGFVITARETIISYRRYILIKFNSAGQKLWVAPLADYYEFAPQPVRTLTTILEATDGTILIGGWIVYPRTGSPVEVFRVSPSGIFLGTWGYSFPGIVPNSRFRSLFVRDIAERNGEFILVGSSSEFDDAQGMSLTYPSALFVNSSGEVINRRTYTTEFGLQTVDFDPTDNSFIVGSINNQGRGVLKLNSAGDVQFRTIIPRRAGESQAYVAVAPNPQDGYLLADTDPVNEGDFRLTLVTRTGVVLPSQTFGGSRPDYLQAFDFGQNGKLVLAGVTQSIDGDLAGQRPTASTASVGWVLSIDPTNCQFSSKPVVSVQTGNWVIPTTWNCGQVPTSIDQARIAPSHSVQLNQSINAGGLAVYGKLQLGAGGTLRLGN